MTDNKTEETQEMLEKETSSSAPDQSQENVRRIRHFPVTMFAGSLGICGLALTWRLAAESFGLPTIFFKIIMGFGIGYTLAVTILYAAKAIRHPHRLKEDLHHPVRGNFLSAGALGMMLIAFGIHPALPATASGLWLVAALLAIFLSALVTDSWIRSAHKADQITPAVFIPAVGLIIGPMTGADMGFDLLCWMMLGAGILGWVSLLPIILNRLYFHGFMSAPLRPTIFIMIAPPALIAIALTRMEGGYMDDTARMLTGIALFTFIYVIVGWRKQLNTPFGLPFWAYTFPLSALCSACFYLYDSSGEFGIGAISIGLLVLSTGTTLYVTFHTLKSFAAGQLFRAPKF